MSYKHRFAVMDQVVDKLLTAIEHRDKACKQYTPGHLQQDDRMVAERALFARDAERVRKMTTEELRKS